MKEITSTTNPLIKDIAKLKIKKYRDDLILIEGEKALNEAISANIKIKYIFSLDKNFEKYETYLVNEAVMKKISTTDSPAKVVAVGYKPVYKLDDFMKFDKIILLDNIKDAGNLGTIIRAAAAFCVNGILLFNDTVDEFSPKTIRSSAGNMFKIPILKISMKELIQFKKTHKFLATVVNSDNFIENYNKKSKLVIMFGSEANGLSEDLLALADEKLTIKMNNNVESLNLALSAGIFLYELQKISGNVNKY